MHEDRDFDLEQPSPPNESALIQDLELNTLFQAMAQGDRVLFDVAKKAVLCGSKDLNTIRYRQRILRDCLENPSVVRDIYAVAVESIENRKRHYYGTFSRYPTSILMDSIELMQMFVGLLAKLKSIARQHAGQFQSEGFSRFFAMIARELDDAYFGSIQRHLRELKFRDGVLISAELGRGIEGTGYMLRKPVDENRNWVKRTFGKKPPVYTFSIHPRDESGARALSELRDRGINPVANALAQSADHINNFFKMLRTELAFYMGCLNLQEQLVQMGEPVSFPVPLSARERKHAFRGLYDVCLALIMEQKVVSNDVAADGRDLVIITGANQGGKSTFLRSIGLAQLMMQSGMFTPAESFRANICDGFFTHYRREEDATMTSGKLEEELTRMSDIVDNMKADAMVLFNESFAATNEREGSEIAGQIIRALLEKKIKIFFVTHLYEFPHAFFEQKMESTLFLRAERQTDGRRTFRLIPADPLQTSYGEDLYRRIIETAN
jgi:hypothetical protein